MMNTEQVRQFQQDLKRTLRDTGIYDIRGKLKGSSFKERFPDLVEAITEAAEARGTLAYYQPPKPYFPEPIALGYSANIMRQLHEEEAERE